ncbi:extracellular solute-binding protein [Chamaesiphon sp.]|uniref:extracellular solute-binding protein n=1 Tax=Chamaesiphon sp. TaxID=2814140 RepID=UPI0035932879
MQRRSFLVTIGSLALGSSLTSCQSPNQSTLRLVALKNSLPPQLVGEFTKSIQPTNSVVELASVSQFTEIVSQLQEWRKTGTAEAKGMKIPFVPAAKSPAYIPNLVSLSDAWLPMVIQEKLIQPIDPQNLTNWSKLEPRWRELSNRDERGNNRSTGQIWGVPYRWGTTVIIYRRDRLAAANIPIPTDWQDLWNLRLKQRISVLDRSREVIGLTLKKLGYSYNHPDLSQVINLKSELAKLHQQVSFYSADNYLQPLIMGDTWVAVGWSLDAIDLVQRNPNIGAIVPSSGTSISTDLWVQPTSPNPRSSDVSKLTQQWLDYCLQPKASNQISLFTSGTAPLLTSLNPDLLSVDIRKKLLILPPKSALDRSEFIAPLPAVSKTQFDRLWEEVRQVKVD